MKLHIGCGATLLDGFINIDNSPTVYLSRFPLFALGVLRRIRLINEQQFGFAHSLKTSKTKILYASCLKLTGAGGIYGDPALAGWGTTMDAATAGEINLSQRAGDSVYVECRK